MEHFVRIAVPFAVAGMVLSMLVGLLAGVSFGVVVVRGLLSAVLIGGGTVAVFVVADKFLPGLLDSSGDTVQTDSPAPAREHRAVDIVVEDEDTDEDNVYNEESEATEIGDDAADELVEEVEEQYAEDAEKVMNQAIAEEKYGGDVEIDDTVLDEMPDIGAFSGAFVDSRTDETVDTVGSDSSIGRSSGSGGNAGNDPATIAKALRTMLSRGEKE